MRGRETVWAKEGNNQDGARGLIGARVLSRIGGNWEGAHVTKASVVERKQTLWAKEINNQDEEGGSPEP